MNTTEKRPLLNDPNDDELVINKDRRERFKTGKDKTKRIGVIFFVTILAFVLLVLVLLLLAAIGVGIFYIVKFSTQLRRPKCTSACNYIVAESIPTNVSLDVVGITTFESYMRVITEAKKKLIYAEFYWDLNNSAVAAAHGEYGNEVHNAIIAAHNRGVYVEILYGKPAAGFPCTDIDPFKAAGIKCIEFDFASCFGGVFHTKFMISDDKRFYLGSANTDWKSFTQVKELGIHVENCSCLAYDLLLQYQTYKHYRGCGKISQRYDTSFNMKHPLKVPFNNDPNGAMWIASSPSEINTKHRADDIKSLIGVIKRAKKFVYIEVMKFLPAQFYTPVKVYWGELDGALKDALFRGVKVKLLIAMWNHTVSNQLDYLYSLKKFNDLCINSGSQPKYKWCHGSMEVRMQEIKDDPNFSPQYGFTRVNHAKFALTENEVGILNSNFCQDYFYSTSGITIYSTHENLRKDVEKIFWRDWDSKYTHNLTHYQPNYIQEKEKNDPDFFSIRNSCDYDRPLM